MKIRARIAAGLVAVVAAFSMAACSLPDTATDATPAGQTHAAKSKTTKTKTSKTTKKAKPAVKKMTTSQANAVRSAKNYLEFQPFSRKGLIRQLSSKVADGYSVKDATFAVDSLDINYNEQAAKAAKNYLDTQGFSHDGLVKQLSSSYADAYTKKQAEYGVKKAGL